MSKFNTIHLFGFGDSQIIGKDSNGTVKSDTLSNLTAFVNHIKTFKPEDVVLTDYHVIHIFSEMDVRYLGKGTDNREDKTDFIVKIAEVDQTILNNLVDELVAAVAPVVE
jgi:cell division FtsZ-interacting protein ZapD